MKKNDTIEALECAWIVADIYSDGFICLMLEKYMAETVRIAVGDTFEHGEDIYAVIGVKNRHRLLIQRISKSIEPAEYDPGLGGQIFH